MLKRKGDKTSLTIEKRQIDFKDMHENKNEVVFSPLTYCDVGCYTFKIFYDKVPFIPSHLPFIAVARVWSIMNFNFSNI